MYEQVMRPATSEYFEDIWRGCDTALLGRWLCSVEKGVVSATLPEQEATWENTRVFRDAGQAVATLRAEPGRDILVLNSATLIQSMLTADLVDDLRLAVALGLHYQRR